jgi:hypothetical protein
MPRCFLPVINSIRTSMVVDGLINMVAEIVEVTKGIKITLHGLLFSKISIIYIYTNKINPQHLSFEDFFVSLADELFSDAQNYE